MPKKTPKKPTVTQSQLIVLLVFGVLVLSLIAAASSSPESVGDAVGIALAAMILMFGVIPLLWLFFLVQYLLSIRSKTALRKYLGWCLIAATVCLAVEGVLIVRWNQNRKQSVPFDTPANRQALDSAPFQTYELGAVPEGYYLKTTYGNAYETNSGIADFVALTYQTNPRDPGAADDRLFIVRQVDISRLGDAGNCEVYKVGDENALCDRLDELNGIPIYGGKSKVSSGSYDYYYTVGTTRIILGFSNDTELGLKEAKDALAALQAL